MTKMLGIYDRMNGEWLTLGDFESLNVLSEHVPPRRYLSDGTSHVLSLVPIPVPPHRKVPIPTLPQIALCIRILAQYSCCALEYVAYLLEPAAAAHRNAVLDNKRSRAQRNFLNGCNGWASYSKPKTRKGRILWLVGFILDITLAAASPRRSGNRRAPETVLHSAPQKNADKLGNTYDGIFSLPSFPNRYCVVGCDGVKYSVSDFAEKNIASRIPCSHPSTSERSIFTFRDLPPDLQS